jgi:hypothetical protein
MGAVFLVSGEPKNLGLLLAIPHFHTEIYPRKLRPIEMNLFKLKLKFTLRTVASMWEIVLLLCLSAWTIADSYIKFTEETTAEDAVKYFQVTLTYLVAMLALLSIHLIRKYRVGAARSEGTGSFRHLPIEEAIRHARSSQKYFNRVRILASTTANIQPLLMMNTSVRINSCTVIVAQPPGASSSLSNRVSTFVHVWIDNHHKKRIQALEIKGYDHTPLVYLVILDDKAMVLGLLTEDKNLNVQMDVGHPILISDDDAESVNLISKWSEWFDSYAARLPTHRDDSRPLSSSPLPANPKGLVNP